ncbi:MATE family efflux transporter [Breoghania sp. L-A4]|uniref:MATE family efflux transporter n=1 Tax=Breoghania sp. L-A4 TaxID=2304600 RepID=UPI000E35C217|nr:MATE family efflux transporter [Breoghania sp. L-A4]AXS39640.1 MATE family efflux transporter [Breoghania sp. L-A4]
MTERRRAVRAFDVSNRDVLALAIPMTLAYLSTPILGVVDTAVIGQLGSAALVGGIAVGGILFDLVFTTFNFLRSGTTGLTAQAYGSGETREIKAGLLRALIIAGVLGLATIALQIPMIEVGLRLLGGSDAVQEATRSYFGIRIYSAPFTLANYAILGWLLGQGRAKTGLLIQTWLNGINIVLSIVFVMGLSWGVAGVALATVISEIATVAFGGLFVWHTFAKGPMPSRARVFNRTRILKMVAVNRDIMIRSFSLLFAFAFFTARGAAQGDVVLAANAILEKFFIVGGYFLDGFATAAETIVGRAIGGRHRPAFDRAVKLTVLWGFVLAGAAAVVFWYGGPWLIDLMTTHEGTRETARVYLVWAALTPLAGVLAFEMDGVFIGATWSRDMRNMMLLSLVAYLATYAVAFPLWGNHGLWLSLEVLLGIRGLSLAFMSRVRAREVFAA